MKKLLILAYDFPPYVSVGGLRPYAWYRYLKEFDVEPVVVTRQWGNKYGNELDYIAPGESNETIVETSEYGTIIRTPYKPNLANRIMLKYGRTKFSLIRKMVTAWYEFMQFLFFVGPKSCLYRGAKEYLKHNKVDVIIATGEPFVLFKYASALSSKYNIPWVADYRDTWTQSTTRQKSKFHRMVNRFFEKKYVRTASQCTTVSEYIKLQISQGIRPISAYKILPNGYNSECIERIKNIRQDSDCFSIAFAGTIYKWHPIDSVFSNVAAIIENDSSFKVKIDFYGINIPKAIASIVNEKYKPLKSIVHIYPKMSNQDLLMKLSHYNALFLFNDYAILGTKIYDWLALKRKIIFCYRNDEKMNENKAVYYPLSEVKGVNEHLQEDLIKETNSGIIVENESCLKQVLMGLHEEFIQKGCIECEPVGVENYSREKQTSLLADIIKQL